MIPSGDTWGISGPTFLLAYAVLAVAVLHRVEQRLISAGLLLIAERRRRIRLSGGWVLAVGTLGVVRVMAGYANNRPVGFLIILVFLVTLCGVLLAGNAPRRTRAGDALLRQLATEYHSLAPSTRPDRAHYGPSGAALAVGSSGSAPYGPRTRRSPPNSPRSGRRPDPSGSSPAVSRAGGSSSGGGCGGGGCGG